ncbi:restriction endonuclease [Kaistia dalseonensis]|uniref:Restriction system protein n=1 Tax=Kaistia dalseonensis TaxID=410840 RepID=A0ABU0HBX1_9HYPH|nr:restriction endonuclease [Kaistia dalseonensis]MCX5497173.1 restriction endonuclease [Kaistia dalseonensis]MDQ0439804.1 restriction system protein [Kaistia dalseonensis]
MATARASVRAERMARAAAIRAEKDAAYEARLAERAALRAQQRPVLESVSGGRGTVSAHASEKARREDYIRNRKAEASDINETLRDYLASLHALLEKTTGYDQPISFAELRITGEPEPFEPVAADLAPLPRPRPESFMAEAAPPKGVSALLPGAKKRWHGEVERMSEQVQAEYDAALTHWMELERARLERLTEQELDYSIRREGFLRKQRLRDRAVAEFEADYRTGDRDAVAIYVGMVLERSLYPDNFPHDFSVSFVPTANLVVVDYELPTIEAVPKTFEVQYIQSNDRIVSVPVRKLDRTGIYQDLIAAIAIRTLHEVFATDQTGLVFNVCFNGYVRTTNPETGEKEMPYLLSVKVTKPEFERIDLARAEKRTCLRGWGAIVSRQPDELVPIRPIVDLDMADRRLVIQTDGSTRAAQPVDVMSVSEPDFEGLFSRISARLGFDGATTRRPSADAVECVAYDSRPEMAGAVIVRATRRREPVDGTAVGGFFETMLSERESIGLHLTTSAYTHESFAFARERPIELIDGKGFQFLLREAGIEARIGTAD